jgi:hypothetical protein
MGMVSGDARLTVRGGRINTLATGITLPFPIQGKEGAFESKS